MQGRFNGAVPRKPDLSTLAGRLAYAREKRGLTQTDLADAAKMKQPAVSKIEKKLMHRTTAIARLAAALGVPAEWLERGEGLEPVWAKGEPKRPPADFSEGDRKPSPSDWVLLDALKWLPDDEAEDVRRDVLTRAAKYEEFVEQQTAKIGRREVQPRTSREHQGGMETNYGGLDEEASDG